MVQIVSQIGTRATGGNIENAALFQIAKCCCKALPAREEMLINAEDGRQLQRAQLAVFQVIHMIIIAGDGGVGFMKIYRQAFSRNALAVLAIDLFLESFGTALPGLNALKALAEIFTAGPAVILANKKAQQYPAQSHTLMPDLAQEFVLLA